MQSALPQLSFELECKPNTLPTSDKGIPQPRLQVVTSGFRGHVDGTTLAGVSEQYGGVVFEKKNTIEDNFWRNP